MLKRYQEEFIEFAIEQKVLQFGEFELKSGRKSPYFFNAGGFNRGATLGKLGEYYAQALIDSGVEADLLFGPAYKGIPLVTTTAVALANKFDRDLPYVFNRKEKKEHGEGGSLVGAPLVGRVLIVDDVITAGTAIREVLTLIEAAGAEVSSVLVGLDRKERRDGGLSAIQALQEEFSLDVKSIIDISHIMTYVGEQAAGGATLQAVTSYQQQYGV